MTTTTSTSSSRNSNNISRRGYAKSLGVLVVGGFLLGLVQIQSSHRSLRIFAEDDNGGGDSDIIRDRINSLRIPILNLVNTHPEVTCPDGLFLVTDSVSGSTSKKSIPQTVHVTSRSRCVPREFYDNLQKWKLDGHSFFFHNDQAMDRLLQRHWPEFPHLQMAMHCHVSGAAKADLWRALVLWEYGGIYTDIDNAPTDEFNATTTIREEDQAFFVIEAGRFLSQYFYAAEPRHPITYMIVQHTLLRLLVLNNVDRQYVPFVTGPGAVKSAFIHFMNDQGPLNEPNNQDHKPLFGKIHRAGVYTGMDNWTVTVLGTARNSNQYVARSVIPRKDRLYKEWMNMTHFSKIPKDKPKLNESCLQRIYYNDPYNEWRKRHYENDTLQQD